MDSSRNRMLWSMVLTEVELRDLNLVLTADQQIHRPTVLSISMPGANCIIVQSETELYGIAAFI